MSLKYAPSLSIPGARTPKGLPTVSRHLFVLAVYDSLVLATSNYETNDVVASGLLLRKASVSIHYGGGEAALPVAVEVGIAYEAEIDERSLDERT